MAPEHPFPIPTEDCFTVTKYVMKNPENFNINNDQIVLSGDSAGANAVAVISQRLLKSNLHRPKLQVLIYPWVQKIFAKTPSQTRYAATGLTGRGKIGLSKFASWYLGITNVTEEIRSIFLESHLFGMIEGEKERERILGYFDISKIPLAYKPDPVYYETHERVNVPTKVPEHSILRREPELAEKYRTLLDPRVSPLLARNEDLIGLPKAYFIVLEWDPIKDEGLLYAQRLKEAGVDVTIGFYEKAFHGCVGMTQQATGYQISRNMQADLIKYLSENL
jgi:acetyl esterase/lipase